MASHTIASGTTISSTYLNSGDSFTLTNKGVPTVASGNAVPLHGSDDVPVRRGIIATAQSGVRISGGIVTDQSGGAIVDISRSAIFARNAPTMRPVRQLKLQGTG